MDGTGKQLEHFAIFIKLKCIKMALMFNIWLCTILGVRLSFFWNDVVIFGLSITSLFFSPERQYIYN